LLIANPMVFMLWGMPDKWRRSTGQAIGKGLHRESRWRHGFRQITNPAAAWFLWVIVLIGWHDPNLYNAALRHEWIHNLEHITFFLAAMLFWWHVTGAGPRIHKQFGLIGRIALVVAAIPPGMLLGVALAFSTGVIYTYYEAVPRLWGIDVLADQQMSGFIMWVPGSMMYIVATLILVFRLLSIEEHKPPLPTSVWASKEAARAPGVKK
jgi:cytochrome c oxidase assembly factor CtaG